MDLLKNLNNMITAEELLDNIEIWDGVFVHSKNAKQAMIEFAKLHVEQALKEASEKAQLGKTEKGVYSVLAVSKNSILNAYPLENIK